MSLIVCALYRSVFCDAEEAGPFRIFENILEYTDTLPRTPASGQLLEYAPAFIFDVVYSTIR